MEPGIDWIYVPNYVISFFYFNEHRGSMNKYFTEKGIRIPYKEFEDFVYGRPINDFKVREFEKREDLKKSLELESTLGLITFDGESIELTHDALKRINGLIRGQLETTTEPYHQIFYRRILVASLDDNNPNHARIISDLKQQKVSDVDRELKSLTQIFDNLIDMRWEK